MYSSDADLPGAGLPPRLALAGISRRFGSVVANEGISLSVQPGEIHALLGENGAGKSTLVKIIYGVLRPDEGVIAWDGEPVAIASPAAARQLGIGMVFQHFSLFEAMSVLENVALGLDRPGPLKPLAARVREVSQQYGLPLDPARDVHSLSVGERQRIEIVRCLLQAPRLLVMDEPTSVLTPQEVERLFLTLGRLAGEGCSILYISHKLDEIRMLCHRATVLRAGRVVASCDPRQESAATMAGMMLGTELQAALPREARATAAQPRPRLAVRMIDRPGALMQEVALTRIALDVHAGEIVGIAGVAGNGQNELLQALSGERLASGDDDVVIDGRPVGRAGPAERRRRGLCCVPEDRHGHGAVSGLSLVENGLLTAHRTMPLAPGGWIDGAAARLFAARVIERFGVRCSGPAASAATLSGGNLQKFIVGREIMQNPGVIVVSQPTWGVDAGAAAVIHRALRDLAAAGAAVLLISQDLDELLTIADRLAVLNGGRLSPLQPTAEVSIAALGLLMGGVHGAAPGAAEGVADAA